MSAVVNRDPALDDFLASVRDALALRDLGPGGSAAIGRIFGALASPGLPGSGPGRRLPVCADCLPDAYAVARRHAPVLARIVDAFQAIEPRLVWAPRSTGGAHASANWPQGHANATIVGPNGLEARADVLVGVSLLAPNVRYPDHHHGPEEVYLVASAGQFRHGPSEWFEPGIGGTLYNEPNIQHAMASEAAPLFAFWFLWAGQPPPAT